MINISPFKSVNKLNISIHFQDTIPYEYNNVLFCNALLIIDDFCENLRVPIEYWSIEEYKKQWHEGLERLKYKNSSCIVTSVYNPQIKPWVSYWPMWKVGSKLYIENHYFLYENYKKNIKNRPFTISTCYKYIPSKSSIKAKIKPSIWIVDLPEEYICCIPIKINKKRTKWSL